MITNKSVITNSAKQCFFILVWHWRVSSEGLKSCPLWSQWRGHRAPPGAWPLALQEYPQSSAFQHLGDVVSGLSSWYRSYPLCHSAEAQKCSLLRERCWLASWCWCWSCVMAQLTSRGERYHEWRNGFVAPLPQVYGQKDRFWYGFTLG